MPYVAEVKNAFEPRDTVDRRMVPAGTTIREAADLFAGEGEEFEYPTVAMLNSEPVLRDQWRETKIGDDDVLLFVLVPEGGVLGAVLVNLFVAVAVGAAIAYALTVDLPGEFEQQEADSVYFLTGQKNQVKLGQPIPSCYGRVRHFPPLATRPYSKFVNNDQYLYQLFCIGQGQYGSFTHQIEDTAVASFDDITIEVYDPGDSVTLFPDNVVTSSEVSSIELYGTNEPEFQIFGPFVANAAGTATTNLEVDVVFPRGLYHTESDGSFSNATATALFEYRAIDDSGAPTGSWTTLNSFSKTLATNQPQRFTLEATVPSGRYQVRGQRTNAKGTDTLTQDLLQWYQLRAILPDTKDYGDVTLVAMKARANNNLNSQTRNRYNVICTRKLEIWNGSSFDAPAETRNPAWAAVDILRASYGANLANSKMDLAGFVTLASTFATEGHNFDFVFDTRTSIWDALKLALRCGRSSPVANMTQISAVRDQVRTVPVMGFSPDSIVKGSFKWDLQLQPDDDYDGIEVEYLDNTTWKQETVQCLIGNDAGTRTQKIRFPGITDRDKAIQAGYYIRLQQIYQRETISFQAGPDGVYPSFGDLIVVGHDVPRWGLTGLVTSIAGDNVTVTLDTRVDNVIGNSIAFRDIYGAIEGPYDCSKVATNPRQVVTTTAINQTNLDFTDSHTPPVAFFGEKDRIYKKMIVTSVTSDAEDNYTITAKNYEELVYSKENAAAPALATASVPTATPTLPTVTNLEITVDSIESTEVLVTWNGAEGAEYYVLERSTDGASYEATQIVTGNSTTLFNVNPNQIFVRVAGVGAGQGPWTTASAAVGVEVRVDSFGNVRCDSAGEQRYIVEV